MGDQSCYGGSSLVMGDQSCYGGPDGSLVMGGPVLLWGSSFVRGGGGRVVLLGE